MNRSTDTNIITQADVSAFLLARAAEFPTGFLYVRVNGLESPATEVEWSFADYSRLGECPTYRAASLSELHTVMAADTPEARKARQVAELKAKLAQLEGQGV